MPLKTRKPPARKPKRSHAPSAGGLSTTLDGHGPEPSGRPPLKLVDEKQAASKLGLSVRTLQKWRLTGCGPQFVKLGHAVRYAERELEDFVLARQRASTSATVNSQ